VSVCVTCNTHFHGDELFCPKDGTPLQAQHTEDRLAGRVLSGRYRLLERLGQGGMGAVYRAHHILMDKAVAVKVLRQELASDAEAVARFHREARSASKLDHEHIIRVTDFGQSDDGLLFLVMELLDGESLAEAIARGPLPWRQAVPILRDVALGLAHAHEQGIIHRDLKPENIILCRRPKSNRQVVKVLDFGLAKLAREAGTSLTGPAAQMSLTRTGVVFGTPEYMSPEQAEGGTLDHRTDIYALGVLMYQMVTGDVPFTAPTFLALLTKTMQEAPVPPSRKAPGIELPEALEALILCCLEKSPARRPQSAEEVIEELERIGPAQRSAERSAELPIPLASTLPDPSRPPLSRPSGPPAAPAYAPTLPPAMAPERADATIEELPRTIEEAPRTIEEPTVPSHEGRRWRPVGLLAAGLLLAVLATAAAPRLLRRPLAPPSGPGAGQQGAPDPLHEAARLLNQKRVDDALALLEAQRRQGNSPRVQRLLSDAHLEKQNRLRALGHMYTAVAMARGGAEEQPTQLALAQLLSRLGHREDSCAAARGLLPKSEGTVRMQAENLIRSLRCEERP
jgi:serine/threonine-protein kinase